MKPPGVLELASRRIGPGAPCFIIAEAGVNHNGRVEMACELVCAAKRTGADAVKFQTWITERLVTPDAPSADYQTRNCAAATSQYAMLKGLELSPAQFREVKRCADSEGILFLSTPDEEESADFLVSLGVPLLKIGSGEVTNLPYLDYLARRGLPLILSTGMATFAEVVTAVSTFRNAGNDRFALLHCVTDYPARPVDCNLRAMLSLRRAFGCPVGFSDHTLGCEAAGAAVALGACIVEKHFTLDRSLPGPDHAASATPTEMAGLVRTIRTVESALGDGEKRPVAAEEKYRQQVRRTIVAARALPAGHCLQRADLALLRSPGGLPPDQAGLLPGRRLLRALPAFAPVHLEDVA